MPNDIFKDTNDPTPFGGVILDREQPLDLRNTPSMERSRTIARERAREASRKPSRRTTRN